ncbi:hypothetical protein NQZ68_019388 [Dissostichus eleginoides]|nr:hypothetical protein NQZ68_019388 [Dissostichus eleginoides]
MASPPLALMLSRQRRLKQRERDLKEAAKRTATLQSWIKGASRASADGEPETKHNDAQNSSDSENEERIETESENEEKETGIEKEETGIENEETGTD